MHFSILQKFSNTLSRLCPGACGIELYVAHSIKNLVNVESQECFAVSQDYTPGNSA